MLLAEGQSDQPASVPGGSACVRSGHNGKATATAVALLQLLLDDMKEGNNSLTILCNFIYNWNMHPQFLNIQDHEQQNEFVNF